MAVRCSQFHSASDRNWLISDLPGFKSKRPLGLQIRSLATDGTNNRFASGAFARCLAADKPAFSAATQNSEDSICIYRNTIEDEYVVPLISVVYRFIARERQ